NRAKAFSTKCLHVDNFGLFRGVVVPEDLTDGELEDEPYLMMLYKFFRGSGYSFSDQWKEKE
ncbi:hypothetical protein, partial [Kingella kingae]|uniref:hypothetical protein n=1 Tax=Kingella kingae TaxID=504 RepID=UPI00254A348A